MNPILYPDHEQRSTNPTNPPEPFSTPVVKCPSCNHGIDPHGSEPGGACMVGGCRCMWQPNDIAHTLIVAARRDAGMPKEEA